MSCQQLTTVCIFMTTCQITSSQFSFIQRDAFSNQFPQSLLSQGVLRRPPQGYHYETMRHILNTYPRNSYTIRYGLSNIDRNQNRGSSSPQKGGQKKKKKKKKKKPKSEEGQDEEPDDGLPPDATTPEAGGNPPAGAPPAGTPPDGTPPAGAPPDGTTT